MSGFEDFLKQYGSGGEQATEKPASRNSGMSVAPSPAAQQENTGEGVGQQPSSSYEEFLRQYGGRRQQQAPQARPAPGNSGTSGAPSPTEEAEASPSAGLRPSSPTGRRTPSPLRDPGNRLARVQDDITQQQVQTPQKSFASDPFGFLFNQPKQAQQQTEEAKQPSDPTAEAGRGKTLPGGQRMETIDPGRLTQESGAEDYAAEKRTQEALERYRRERQPEYKELDNRLASGELDPQAAEVERNRLDEKYGVKSTGTAWEIWEMRHDQSLHAESRVEDYGRMIEHEQDAITRLQWEMNEQAFDPAKEPEYRQRIQEHEQRIQELRSEQLENIKFQLKDKQEAAAREQEAFNNLSPEEQHYVTRNVFEKTWDAIKGGSIKALSGLSSGVDALINFAIGDDGLLDMLSGGEWSNFLEGGINNIFGANVHGNPYTELVYKPNRQTAAAWNAKADRIIGPDAGVQLAANATSAVEIMLPYILLNAYLSSVAAASTPSAAASAMRYTAATNTATSSYELLSLQFTHASLELAGNVSAQYTFMQEFGNGLLEAEADGADKKQAALYALYTATLNTIIEFSGGVEDVNANLSRNPYSALSPREMVSTIFHEDLEELAQGFVGDAFKAVYQEVNYFSGDDPVISKDKIVETLINTTIATPFITLAQVGVTHGFARVSARVDARNQRAANQIISTLDEAAALDLASENPESDAELIRALEEIGSNRRLSRVFEEMYKTSPQDAIESIRQSEQYEAQNGGTPSVTGAGAGDTSLGEGGKTDAGTKPYTAVDALTGVDPRARQSGAGERRIATPATQSPVRNDEGTEGRNATEPSAPGHNAVSAQEAAGAPVAQEGTETAAQAPQNATAQAPVLNSNEGATQEKTAPVGADESTVVNTNPAQHTAAEQRVIDEYQDAVDENLVSYIETVQNNPGAKLGRYSLKPVNDRAAADIQKITGINVTGNKTAIEPRIVEHILKDHGPAGRTDQSLRDVNDIARIQYVLDNYDSVSDGGTTKAYQTVKGNGLPGQAKTVVFEKAVNGTYYVVEAVPDTKAKTLFVVSAYMSKKSPGAQQTADANASRVTSETKNADTPGTLEAPASNSNIAQPPANINTQNATSQEQAGRYAELGEQYGTIEAGEIPSRKSSVPKKSGENEVVSKTARTLYEAAATPDRLLPTIQAAVVNGDLSHIPVENKTLANNAATMLRMKGFDTALRDWTADVRAGKRSDELTAMGAVLYNNAANSNIDGKALVDLIMDYTYLTSGTGSALNAAKILKRLSPEGKIYSVQKAVNEINSARNVDAARRAKKSAKKAQKTARKSATETETAKGTTNTAEETESKAAEETENRKVTEEDNVPVSEWAERAGESVADSLADKLRAQADGKVTEKKLKTMCQIAEEDVKKILKSYGTEHQNLDSRALENILTNPAFYNTLYNSLRSSLQTKANMSAEEIAELGHEWIDKPLADILAQMAAQQSDIHVNEGLVKAYLDVSNLTKEDGTPLSAEQQDAMRDEIMDAILKDIARQVPSTIGEKIRAIRYLNMLGNLKTQGRNVIGNTASTAMRIAKDTVKGTLELGLHAVTGGRYERTTSLWVPPSLMSECLKDFQNVKDVAMGEAKYSDGRASNVRREIEEKKRVFKPSGTWGTDKATGAITGSKAAKALRTAVDAAEWLPEGYRLATKWAMEFGDLIFSGENYAASLARYLYAHKVSSIEDASPELLDKARAYAVRQAQETTFRDSNAVSTWVSGLGRNAPLLVRGAISGALPFRKTPANVLVRAYEYSPLGVLTSFKYAYDVIRQNGKATGQDLVDMLSKNLTGTGLFLLGMLLHRRGWLRTKDDDDKLEQFHKDQGAQDWSLSLKDGSSYTLDWLAPASMPLFMGAVYDQLDADEDISGNDALRLIASLSEPMMEMSMLSGLNDSIEAATARNAPLPPILQFGLNSLLNMASQTGVNSLYRQYEQAQEENRSTYWTDPDSKLPEIVQKALAQSSVGLPGPGYQRMDYVDAWGRKQDKGSTGERYLQAFVSPWYKGKDRSTPYDAELERLYKGGYTNVIPQAPSRKDSWATEGGEKITIGLQDYQNYAIAVGQNKLELIGDFLDSDEYKTLDDEARAEIIGNLYDYATWQARRDYAEDHGASMPKSQWDKVESVEKAGVDPADYLLGKKQADTDESGSLDQKEVFSWLLGSDYSNGQKRTIWNETTGGSTSWDQYRDKHPAAILAGFHVDEDRAAAIATEINGGKADWSNVSSLSNEELYDYYAKHPDQERYVKALYNAKGSDTSWDEMVEEQEAKDAKDPVNVLTRDFGYSQRDAERLWNDINTDRVNGVTQAEFYSFYQRHPELQDELRAMWAAHWPKHKGIDYYKPKK